MTRPFSSAPPGKLGRSAGSAFHDYLRTAHDDHGQRQQSVGKRSFSVVSALTVGLCPTYQRCSPHFVYSHHLVPRRVLTKPSEGVENQGYDNAHSDLIVYVHDVFTSTTGARYVVKDLLGQGTFGQVFRCLEADSGQLVAVKVIKNQAAYYHQARVEVGVLQYLNTKADPGDKHHIVRMKDFFLFRNHLCLAFELLNLNLYELIRHNKFRGLSLPLVRVFTTQILDALVVLRDSRIVHCDLKPENVLLKTIETGEVKVIDFGSACFESRTVYSYIQSRFYRSPEVVVGYPYTMAIDMWSLGCMAAELFLGLPLFPGACEHDLLCRMLSVLGQLPETLLAHGKNTHRFFKVSREDVVIDPATGEAVLRRSYAVRSREEYEAATGQAAPVGKNYFQHTSLGDIIGAYPLRCGLSEDAVARERRSREAFVDFLRGVLDLNPASRWTPRQALQHPFITGERFTGPFQPPADPTTAPGGQARWDASPSPSPVGTPMSIPGTRAAARTSSGSMAVAAAGVGTPVWLPGMAAAGSAAAAAAAMMATSPQVHAQAHAAAMAAVQVHMSLRQQQQQQGAAGALSAAAAGVGGSGLQNGYYLGSVGGSEYNAAHSLQSIIPTLAAAVAASYGAAGMSGTPLAQSLATPLLSPPSRSFGPHLRYNDYSAALLGSGAFDGGASSSGGMVGMQQTPTRSSLAPGQAGQAAFSPMQLGSFTPSSVTTYQAALAAAHAAMQQQQAAAAAAAQQQPLDSAALLSQSARLAHAAAAQQASAYAQQAQQQALVPQRAAPYQAAGSSAAAAATATTQASWGGPPSAGYPLQHAAATPSRTGLAAGAAGLRPYMGVQEQPAGAALLGGGGGDVGRMSIGGSRWVSMEGSLDGTPPGPSTGSGLLSVAAAADESGPNPADWDPLWSDDLLEEESQGGATPGQGGGGGGGQQSPGAGLRGSLAAARQQALPSRQQGGASGSASAGPLVYGGDWFRDQGGSRQQGQEQQQRQQSAAASTAPHAADEDGSRLPAAAAAAAAAGAADSPTELPGSYCLPLPTSLLLGLPQQPNGGAQQAPGQGKEGGAGAPDLPLPSSALLGGRQQRERAGSSGVERAAQPTGAQPMQGGANGGSSSSSSIDLRQLQAGARAMPDLWRQQQQQQQQQPPPVPPGSGSFEFHQGGAADLRAPPHFGQAASRPGEMMNRQQQQQQQQAQIQPPMPAAYQPQEEGGGVQATPFAHPYAWLLGGQAAVDGGAIDGGSGLGAAAAALQQALSAQLSTQLTRDLAMAGLDSEEIATAAYQARVVQQQQQQQAASQQVGVELQAAPAGWSYGTEEQQQAALPQNQPLQRTYGFDTHSK